MSGGHERDLLLAFDTSGSLGSVCVARGDRILARGFLTRRGEHASHLVPRIRDTLRTAGVEMGDLDGVLVGEGPGSFTGVRVAAATAKGLTHALGVALWPVSSLAAGAASVGVRVPLPDEPLPTEPVAGDPFADEEDPEEAHSSADGAGGLPEGDRERPRYVLFDARADRVFAACYRFLRERLELLVPPGPDRIGELLAAGPPEGALFCGEGALRHSPEIQEAGYPVLSLPAGLPTAQGLLRVHRILGERAPEPSPNMWEPAYLREWKGSTFDAGVSG